jgi:hypothetical protein
MVQGATLVYRQGEQEQELAVDTAAWFAWLETASSNAVTHGSPAY